MRTVRFIALGTVLAVSGAVTAGPATAAAGVGTTTVSASLLSVELGAGGSLLGVRLLGDDARATTDPTVGPSEAYSRLTALRVTSSALPAPLNDLSLPAPPLESKSPGGAGSVTSTVIDLANPATGVVIPAPVLSGSVSPATLTSAVDADGARASLANSLANLAAVGGLVSAQSVASTLATTADATKANAGRVIGADSVAVLDFGALLDGLGLTLADLPVASVTSILDGLGVPAGALAAGDLEATVGAINAAVDALQALTPSLSDPLLVGTVPPELATLLTGAGVDPGAVPVTDTTSLAAVQATIDSLQGTLAGVLADALTALDGLTLLEVDGVEVGVVARATDSLADTLSAVSARIGSVKLGGITLPAVDLKDTAAQVNAAVANVNSVIASALGAVAPGLSSVVDVDLLTTDADNGVSTASGYNRSVAGLTAVAATITPPVDLASIISTVEAAAGIGDAIVALGGTVPVVSTVMGALETALGDVQALAQGPAAVRVASLRSVSTFVAAAPANSGELPRTGSNTAALAAFGALLAALAVGVRRYVMTPSRTR